MFENDHVIQTLLAQHIELQKFLTHPDPNMRRMMFENLLVLDNRAYSLIFAVYDPSVTLKKWFDYVDKSEAD